jgi:hypothetical protein
MFDYYPTDDGIHPSMELNLTTCLNKEIRKKFERLIKPIKHRDLLHFDKKTKKYCHDMIHILNQFKHVWREWKPTSPSEILNQELQILILKLTQWEIYIDSLGKPPILNGYLILKNILMKGPEFSLSYRKDMDYSIKLNISTSMLTPPEGINIYKFEDIDQFFPPRHLIPFIHDGDYDDILENSLKPLK